MPPPKAMSRLPSASVITAPSAWTTAIGVTAGTPRGTALARRANSARLSGPGILVWRRMTPDMKNLRMRSEMRGKMYEGRGPSATPSHFSHLDSYCTIVASGAPLLPFTTQQGTASHDLAAPAVVQLANSRARGGLRWGRKVFGKQ